MTTSTATIATFITRMLDADEAAARAATRGPWREVTIFGGRRAEVHCTVGRADDELWDLATTRIDADATHIARHDPARVLAQVAALRKVLEHCDVLQGRLDDHDAWDVHGVDDILRALASIWADDPGWQGAWR